MEISDELLLKNCDWDPSYLQQLFKEDFNECDLLWVSDITDMELVKEVETIERYNPITEDISLDDEYLCAEVDKIEKEYVCW